MIARLVSVRIQFVSPARSRWCRPCAIAQITIITPIGNNTSIALAM